MKIETLSSVLPVQARWMIGDTPLDFDFTAARHELQKLPDEVRDPGDTASAELFVFGEQDYCEGGGASPFLCIRAGDGAVYGYDSERDDSMFLLNSSLERFVATFRLLDGHLARSQPLPPDCESQLQAIDSEAYPDSMWRFLVEHLRSEEQVE